MRRTRALAESTRTLLRRRLGSQTEALPFAEAVALQVAHPLGGGAPPAEDGVVERVVGLLDRCAAEVGDEARALAADPELLASVFQNIDLLYAHRYPHADRLAGCVMAALELSGGRA